MFFFLIFKENSSSGLNLNLDILQGDAVVKKIKVERTSEAKDKVACKSTCTQVKISKSCSIQGWIVQGRKEGKRKEEKG